MIIFYTVDKNLCAALDNSPYLYIMIYCERVCILKKTYIKETFKSPISIRAMLRTTCEKYGDKIAYKAYNYSNDIVETTYKEFYTDYTCFGTALAAALDLSKKKIAILSENRPEWILSYCAIIGCGSVVIPMDKELLPSQIEAFLNYANAEAVICSGRYLDKVLGMNMPNIKHIICFDGGDCQDKRFCDYSQLIAEGEKLLSEGCIKFTKSRYDTSKMSALIFTSGTTGTSKGVMLSEDNIVASMTASANMIHISSNNVLLSVLPMHHTYETCCGQLTALMLGVTICINNSLKYFVRNLKIFKPTTMVLVPLFVSTLKKKIQDEIKARGKQNVVDFGIKATKLLRKVKIDTRKYAFAQITANLGGRLRTIISGGAPLDPDCVEWFENIGISISQGYGITECAPLVAVNPLVTVYKNSVGLPIPGSRVKIILENPDGTERDAYPGVVGEICVKGPHVMLGYYNDPKATEEAFTEEGFFRTGDYGYMDEEGFLFITGRKKNIIVLQNGKNVYPEEIEEYLSKIDLIKECVVVGRTKESGDVVLTALIYPDYDRFKGCSDDEIISRMKSEVYNINKKLPIFKQVRSIELKKNEFEKTTSQKIIRYKLS